MKDYPSYLDYPLEPKKITQEDKIRSMSDEEAIKSLNNIVEYWTYKPIEVEATKLAIKALKEKIKYDEYEQTLQKEFGNNIKLLDIIRPFILNLQKQTGEPLNGFRILTNQDKENYEQWKKEKQEHEGIWHTELRMVNNYL